MENKIFECILDGLIVSRPKNKGSDSIPRKSPFKKNTFLDLSSQHLFEFKALQYTHLCDIRYLYLKNNQIKYLEPETFNIFPLLVWLDLRNNDLTTFPSSVVNSPNLTTILLENNNLHELPVEIGSLKHLKNVMLRGNPLLSPLREIIESGPKKTTEYLKNKWYEVSGIEPPTSPEKVDEKERSNSLIKTRKKLYHGDGENSFDSVGSRWSDEIRIAMEQQEKYLKKKKDVETLKEWRRNYTSMPKLGSKDKEPPPFDLDERYMKVMSRDDLAKPTNRSPTKHRAKINKRNIQEDLEEIQKSLLEIKSTRFNLHEKVDQLEKIKFAKDSEISKLRELQKRLQDLKMKN